jgi:hypothetical protein
MKSQELYLLRAADAHAEAEVADLENVRERCLRSEAAWKEMAARAERTEQLRAANEAEKAADRETERQ